MGSSTGGSGSGSGGGGLAAGRCRGAAGRAALCLALVVYTVFGGLVFRWLEYPGELSRLQLLRSLVNHERTIFLHSLLQSNFTQEQLTRYEAVVQYAATRGLVLGESESLHPQWSHPQAIFFASTVLTTIGYGNITPRSTEGRLFCILFALVGIPLTVTVLADLGSLLASRLPALPEARGLSCSLFTAAIASSILMAYVAIGSLLFMSWEGWTFFDAFYFCFVTMTTIGFGDFVPRSESQYMLMCTLYVLLGLSLTSTIIEVLRQQYSQSWRHIQALAEVLGQLASSERGPGAAGSAGQWDANLRAEMGRVAAVVELPRGGRGGGEWSRALRKLTRELAKPRPPPLVQIVVYESSV